MRQAKTVLSLLSTNVVISLAGFVTTWYISNTLGAGPFGVYTSLLAALYWIHIPANAVNSSIIKGISESVENGAYIAAASLLNGGYALLVVVLLWGFRDWVSQFIGMPIDGVVIALVVGYFGLTTSSSVLEGQHYVTRSGIVWTVDRLLRSIIQISLIGIGYGLSALIVGHAVGVVIAVLIAVLMWSEYPSRPRVYHFRRVFDYGRYAWIGTVRSRAFGSMDILVLTAFAVGSSLIGVYKVSWTLASTLALISSAISQTLFPSLSELSAEGNYEKIVELLDDGLVYAGVFAIPGLFGVIVIGERILRIYGSEFTAGATVLIVLVFARVLDTYAAQFINAINAIDRPDVAFRVNSLFIFANLLLNLSLVAKFGWLGAATATALSALVALIVSYIALSMLVKEIRTPLQQIGLETIAALLMAGVIYGVESLVPQGNIITIILVLLGASVYFITLLTLSSRIRRKILTLTPSQISQKLT